MLYSSLHHPSEIHCCSHTKSRLTLILFNHGSKGYTQNLHHCYSAICSCVLQDKTFATSQNSAEYQENSPSEGPCRRQRLTNASGLNRFGNYIWMRWAMNMDLVPFYTFESLFTTPSQTLQVYMVRVEATLDKVKGTSRLPEQSGDFKAKDINYGVYTKLIKIQELFTFARDDNSVHIGTPVFGHKIFTDVPLVLVCKIFHQAERGKCGKKGCRLRNDIESLLSRFVFPSFIPNIRRVTRQNSLLSLKK
ncbi:hypothetical protein Naga_100016g76 [Nannochloropsis gaditana]|uniref:Uncharacterized protein n=1 Tax=Nannochloropsis gaditana TaxID=72520 RepID=W7TNN0_9STRA|nr:hypothetical protein Naga_100016g76 [Nannochloropsis gaditana]